MRSSNGIRVGTMVTTSTASMRLHGLSDSSLEAGYPFLRWDLTRFHGAPLGPRRRRG